jgi:hypothetical protein
LRATPGVYAPVSFTPVEVPANGEPSCRNSRIAATHARPGSVCVHVREAEHEDQRGIVELDHTGDAGGGGSQHHGAVGL